MAELDNLPACDPDVADTRGAGRHDRAALDGEVEHQSCRARMRLSRSQAIRPSAPRRNSPRDPFIGPSSTTMPSWSTMATRIGGGAGGAGDCLVGKPPFKMTC